MKRMAIMSSTGGGGCYGVSKHVLCFDERGGVSDAMVLLAGLAGD